MMARRAPNSESHTRHPGGAGHRGGALEIVIAVCLGLVAIATAGAVYLNEKQEHKATADFHRATHLLVSAGAAGLSTPQGKAAGAASDREFEHAEDQQEKATRYTLVEVVLASSLFLLGVAGVASEARIKLGALIAAGFIFATAIVLLATA